MVPAGSSSSAAGPARRTGHACFVRLSPCVGLGTAVERTGRAQGLAAAGVAHELVEQSGVAGVCGQQHVAVDQPNVGDTRQLQPETRPSYRHGRVRETLQWLAHTADDLAPTLSAAVHSGSSAVVAVALMVAATASTMANTLSYSADQS